MTAYNFISKIISSEIVKNIFIYFIGAMALKGIGIILIPLYTVYLTPDEYGMLELFDNFLSISTGVLSLGLTQVLFIEYYKVSGYYRKKLIDNIISIYLLIATLLFFILVIFTFTFKENFFRGQNYFILLLLLINVYLTFFQNLYLTILKIAQKAYKYTIVQFVIACITFAVIVFFVVFLKYKIFGIILANFIVIILVFLFTMSEYLKSYRKFQFNFSDKSQEYLKIGLPFIPGILATWLLFCSDKWVLQYYGGSSEVGIYAIACKFGAIYNAFMIVPFINAYIPFMFNRFSNGKYEQKIFATFLIFICIFVFLGIVTPKIAVYVVNKTYFQGFKLIPYMVLSYCFFGLTQVALTKLLYSKKTFLMFYICFSVSGLNLFLNFILIKCFKAQGAAYSSLITNILWFLIVWIFTLNLNIDSEQKKL